MKMKYCMLSIFICSIFVSCSKGQNSEVNNGLGAKSKIELKQNVINLVKEYINTVNSDRSPENNYKVFRLLIEQSDYEVSFRIYPIIYYSHLIKDPPSSYLDFKDGVVLINTGIEKISTYDQHFLEEIKTLVGRRLENDLAPDGKTISPEYRYRTHNPPVWKITVGNSLIIDKEAEEPVRVKFVNK